MLKLFCTPTWTAKNHFVGTGLSFWSSLTPPRDVIFPVSVFWQVPLPAGIQVSGQKSTHNTLKVITIRQYPVKNRNRYGILYQEHIFLLPVKSHSQSLCLVVLLASPSFSGDSPPNTYEEQSIFSIFLISISLWTPSLKLITTISSPDKLIMKVYDNHEDPSVWAGPFLPPDEAGKVADHDFEQHLVWTLKSREEETVYNYVTVAVRSHAHCHNLLNKCSHLIKLAMKLVAIMSTLLYEHWSRPHWTWRCRSSYWGSATSSSLPISTPSERPVGL